MKIVTLARGSAMTALVGVLMGLAVALLLGFAVAVIGVSDGEGEGIIVGKGCAIIGASDGEGEGSLVGKLTGMRVLMIGAVTGT